LHVVIVDLESYPIDDAGQYIAPPEPPDLDAIQAAGNLKDPLKIADSIAQRKVKALADYEQAVAAYAVQIGECATDPDLCRIVALGWCYHDSEIIQIQTARDASEERLMLERFWTDVRNALFVTFAGNRFDLPTLMRRSQLLNVRFPQLNIDRYRSPHRDLQSILTFHGAINMKGKSLKFYCSRFGIPNDDMTTGAQIGEMVRAGDWPGIVAHCEADVKATKALAARLGVLPTAKTVEVAEGAF
jgi:hypothetical protein